MEMHVHVHVLNIEYHLNVDEVLCVLNGVQVGVVYGVLSVNAHSPPRSGTQHLRTRTSQSVHVQD